MDGIDPAFDPDHPFPPDLIAHGVGQRLARVGAWDLVAVVVDPGVEQGKREGAVPAQDRPAQRPQAATTCWPGVGLRRREGRVLGIRWAAATEVTHDRPERITTFGQAAQGGDPTPGEVIDLGVKLGQIMTKLVSSNLEPNPMLPGRLDPATPGLDALVKWASRSIGGGSWMFLHTGCS